MVFRYLFLFLLCDVINFLVIAEKFPAKDASDTFDNDLYESVLDPELCRKQLQYVVRDPSLLLQFLDAGLRIPRGIPQGNTIDYGNYPQCLSINRALDDMTIQGKYCRIRIPVNLNLNENDLITNNIEFDPTQLHVDEEQLQILEQIHKKKTMIMSQYGMGTENNNLSRDNSLSAIAFELAICLPQTCTTGDAISALFFNTTDLGFLYDDMYCRLPDDKPWVPADYIAWSIVLLLGLCTVLSTSYDVHHTVILKKDPKEASPLLSAFSAYRNAHNLVKITKRPGTLECLDGIRTLSILWVIFGHTFMLAANYPANPLDILEWYTSYKGIVLKTAPLAVDSFFLISGLLVVYTTAKKLTTIQLAKNLHLFYLHRLLRMFPVLAAVVLFKTSFYHHISDGPIWHVVGADSQSCRSYWWVTLLYLQNFLTPTQSQGCVPETWYLAIDIQLHILSPLVLFWVLKGSKRPAWIALISAFLISTVIATAYTFANDFTPGGLDSYVYYYVNILTRAPPFFIGMIFGYVLHLYREKRFPMSKVMGYSLTALAIGLITLVLYTEHINIHGNVESQALDDIFRTYMRTFWVLGTGWIIFACVKGYAGPINWFFSLKIWKIPSRISYAMYLIHISFMLIYYGSTIDTIYFSVGSYMFDYFAFLYITIFIAFFVTVLIDAPFATLFKLLFEVGKKDTRHKEKNETQSKENTENDKTNL